MGQPNDVFHLSNGQGVWYDRGMSNLTKRAIAASFKELLLEKPLNKITVADITEKCGVNRQTFYYHFQDVYNLIEWICVEDTEQVIKLNKTYQTWQDGLLAVFGLAKKDKAFLTNIYRSSSHDNLQQYLYRLCEPLICGVVSEVAKKYRADKKNVEFAVCFYKYAFVGFLLDWVRDDMKGEPKEITERIAALVRGTAEQFFQKYNQ